MLRNKASWIAAAALLGLLGLLVWPSVDSGDDDAPSADSAASSSRRLGARPPADGADETADLSVSKEELSDRIKHLQRQLTSASASGAADASAVSELSKHRALVRALGPSAPEVSRASVAKALSEEAESRAGRAAAAGDAGAAATPDQLQLAIALLQAGASVDSLAPWRPAAALHDRPVTAADFAAQLELRALLMRDSSQRNTETASKLDTLRSQAHAKLTLILRDQQPLTGDQWAMAGAVLRNTTRATTPARRDYLSNLFAKLRALPPPDDLELQAARLEALATGAIAGSLTSNELRVHFSQMAAALMTTADASGSDPTQDVWWRHSAATLRALQLARTVIFVRSEQRPRTE